MNKIFIYTIIIISLLTFSNCKKKNSADGSFNLFSLKDDIKFGNDFHQEILSNPSEYPLLDENKYASAYNYLYSVRDSLLKSQHLNYAKDFEWKCYIIDKDILNAFCTPGGNMYFYSGIIKYLDNEAQFAGVMAHEMAHADRRHVTDKLTTAYSLDIMWQIVMGQNTSKMTEIAKDLALGLGALQFSQKQEYEADKYAVLHTQDAGLYPKGIAGFFEKLNMAESENKVPTFLSTHPSPQDRLQKIDETYNTIPVPATKTNDAAYAEFQLMLP